MTYREEMKEVQSLAYRPIVHLNHTAGLPDGFMVVQDGSNFWPKYYSSEHTERSRAGWFLFFVERKTVRFSSLEEAQGFIAGFVGFLKWMGSGVASHQGESYEEMLAAQYTGLAGQVVYYTETCDGSARVARLLQASRAGVLLADPAESEDMGCWYSYDQVRGLSRGRQHGWR